MYLFFLLQLWKLCCSLSAVQCSTVLPLILIFLLDTLCPNSPEGLHRRVLCYPATFFIFVLHASTAKWRITFLNMHSDGFTHSHIDKRAAVTKLFRKGWPSRRTSWHKSGNCLPVLQDTFLSPSVPLHPDSCLQHQRYRHLSWEKWLLIM